MYKIHCLNNIAKVGTDRFGEDYGFTDELSDADAIMVRSANLHETEFSNQLLAIARAGAGVNNIPIDECAEKAIVVFNTPGANANAVKELVISGMLLASRDIVGGIEWVRENWDNPNVAAQAEKAKKQFGGTEISGKTIGVIGLGAIGANVANVCVHLGMHVVGYDPYLSIKSALSLNRHVRVVNNLKDLLSTCDFITIHVPATKDTTGMINREAIEQCKKGVVFLNFARDILVDEQAMAEALKSSQVKRYVTDFANQHSTMMKHAIVTPHLGASTVEAEDNCAVMAANELIDYLENGNIVNSVNYAAVDLGPLSADGRLCIFHENTPGAIGTFSTILSDSAINIENMTNKSRGNNAYTLIEYTGKLEQDILEKISSQSCVRRTRRIKKQ